MESLKQNKNYKTFFLMLACSFVVMYIAMYLSAYAIDHVYFSLIRFYMACWGLAAMAVIMWFYAKNVAKQEKEYCHFIGQFDAFCQCVCSGKGASAHYW